MLLLPYHRRSRREHVVRKLTLEITVRLRCRVLRLCGFFPVSSRYFMLFCWWIGCVIIDICVFYSRALGHCSSWLVRFNSIQLNLIQFISPFHFDFSSVQSSSIRFDFNSVQFSSIQFSSYITNHILQNTESPFRIPFSNPFLQSFWQYLICCLRSIRRFDLTVAPDCASDHAIDSVRDSSDGPPVYYLILPYLTLPYALAFCAAPLVHNI